VHIVVRRYSTSEVHRPLGAREVVVCVLPVQSLHGDLSWMALLSDFVASCFYPLKAPINMYYDCDDERALEDGILVSDVCSWDKLPSETFSVTVLSWLGPKLHTTSDFRDPRSSFVFNTGMTVPPLETTVSNLLLSLPTIADLRISLPPLYFPRDQ
jgi:hypothetical protein